jgi:hypothetical protein
MCWTFGVCEGDLDALYWTYSFRELRQRLQLKYGELYATQLCQYNSLAQVVSAALGGKTESEPEPMQAVGGSGDVAADVAMINSLLRG